MNDVLMPVIFAYRNYFGVAEHPVVWDVGSRDGRDGVELAERIGEADAKRTIVALEPNPAQADVIKKAFPEINVIELAASDRHTQAKFMVYEGDEGAVGSSSLLLDWKEDDLVGHEIMVETERLDWLIYDEIIDVMKIDCEGTSMDVLIGLGDKIHQIRVMHIETEDWTGSDVAVKGFMASKGFDLVDERQEWPGMPDLTYVNMAMVK